MTILQQDVRLFKSDKMDDTDAGGGDITQNQIISGVPNTIFDPISPLDRAFGNLTMRKIFSSIFTQNTDRYFGAHSIITRNPKDETANVCLFTTNDHHDRRDKASSKVEAYRTQSLTYSGTLLGTQFQQSKTLKLFQTVGQVSPPIGTVFVLTSASNANVQYVKITDASITTEQFTVDGKTFEKDVMTLTLSQPLKYDFVGVAAVTEDTATNPDARLYTTEASDSAKYYGSRPIDDPIVVGQSFVKCDTVFSQLIPATSSQIRLLDVNLTGTSTGGYDSDNDTITHTYAATWNANTEIKLPAPFRSGTLSITGSGTMTDVNGNLVLGATVIGTVNYAAGTLLLSANAPSLAGVKTVTITPQPRISMLSDAISIPITDVNRGLAYVENVGDSIAVGSVVVSVLSFGTWYDMVDDGAGALVATNGIGTGEIVYDTGSLSVELTAFPDVDSEIIIYYTGAYDSVAETSESPVLPTPEPIRTLIESRIENVLPLTIGAGTGLGIDPASISITNDLGTVITGAADGTLSGTGYDGKVVADGSFQDGTGSQIVPVSDYTSKIYMRGINAEFTATFDTHNVAIDDHNVPTLTALYSGDVITVQIDPSKSMFKGSIVVLLTVNVHDFMTAFSIERSTQSKYRVLVLKDDGNGKLVTGAGIGDVLPNSNVDYLTSTITLDVTEITMTVPNVTEITRSFLNSPDVDVLVRETISVNVTKASTLDATLGGVPVLATAATLNDLVTSGTSVVVPAATSFDWVLVPPPETDLQITATSTTSTPAIIQESVVVKIEGVIYTITSDNKMTTVLNDIVIEAGTYNPSTGIATVKTGAAGVVPQVHGFAGGTDSFEAVTSSSFIGQNLPTTRLATESKNLVFRIPEVPIQTASFSFRVQQGDGTVITGTSDVNGDITGTGVTGDINFTTGVVHVAFSDWIVRETLEYNAVAESFLSLDAEILGIDAVRLPENGKVRIFDTGDIVVVFNEVEQNGTFTSNTQTDLGRVALSEIRIIDSFGVPVDSALFSTDLDLGLIDWGDLAGVSQPLDIYNVIEDIGVVKEFEINGKLTFTQPLTHDYPVTGTLVGSAIGHGDLFATSSEPFDQKTWTNVWSDSLIGSSVSAEFNTSIHPIVMSNASTIDERWVLYFSNSTSVNVIGETVGQVATNLPISSDIAPINPATGFPYFEISAESFGAGWVSGNVIRFNSISANVPIWAIQSVIQGEPTNTDDDALTWCLSTRGGVESL